MVRYLSSLLALFWCLPVFAQPPVWQIDPEQSVIRWTAVQNGAEVKGRFKQFSADIRFDRDQLDQSKALVTVNTGSIDTSYDEARETLHEKDWFNTADFPKAIFETQAIQAKGENHFTAESRLTIKGHDVPVTLDFSLEETGENQVKMQGSATLQRRDFDIGWVDTETIKDKVRVDVELVASKQ